MKRSRAVRMSCLFLWTSGLALTAALLVSQTSSAGDRLPPKRIDAPQSLSGLAYRGRLDSAAGPLAVLVRDARERVVAVGDTLVDDWKVIAIDAQAVSVQHMLTGVHQRLWFGGAASDIGLDRTASMAPHPRLSWRSPSTVSAGSEFSIVLSLAGPGLRSGVVELEYDAAVLRVVDATGAWQDQRGRTRLRITDVDDGDDLAEVAFRVVAQQPTVTPLRATYMELVGVAGDQLPAPPEDELQIQIAAAPASSPEER